jgi:hypothetical protein
MSLKIETYSNVTGSNAFFKALSHPDAQAKIKHLVNTLKNSKKVALYDPLGLYDPANTYFNFKDLSIQTIYCQDTNQIGKTVGNHTYEPITALNASQCDTLLILTFDADVFKTSLDMLLKTQSITVHTLDEVRVSDAFITHKRKYLNPLNFVTNFVFFRAKDGYDTTFFTKNYWLDNGSKKVSYAAWLFDDKGALMAHFIDDLKEGSILISSKEIQKRFHLHDFVGQLFVHIIGAEGHDVFKYALDIEGADGSFSCTHDANSFPAEYYAGLPAPQSDEKVIFWLQNSHPFPIPAGTIGFQVIGEDNTYRAYPNELEGYGTVEIVMNDLMPDVEWPKQIEAHTKKYIVRPRYEVLKQGKRRIAHLNVERTDLKPDAHLATLGQLMGKGFILPAPIFNFKDFQNIILPTPMARSQQNLPFKLHVYDADGSFVMDHPLGLKKRHEQAPVNINELMAKHGKTFASGYGHMELLYDFSAGQEADGWLHALCRYEHNHIEHQAETSFGGHIFNTVLTYKDEPQSYSGRAPGLRTKIFLRLSANENADAFCHLIYCASTPWHEHSKTTLSLFNKDGQQLAEETLHIPCSGSRLWHAQEIFGKKAIQEALEGHVMIRDLTCRLFGYHGLRHNDGRFSLDHMFGF